MVFSHKRLATTTMSWDNAHNTTSKGIRQRSSDYAYSWVIGGIHEDKPSYKPLPGVLEAFGGRMQTKDISLGSSE